VTDDHTYYVGDLHALVHNAGLECSATPPEGMSPGIGQFGPNDVAYGVASSGDRSSLLSKFAGEAERGTAVELSPSTRSLPLGPARNLSVARDTLRYARDTLERTGGKLRFNLDGVDVQ
jgi:hypothetical protein